MCAFTSLVPHWLLWGKKSGGVQPIAVGCTLQRLVAEVDSCLVVNEMVQDDWAEATRMSFQNLADEQIGPLLFLSIHCHCDRLKSAFRVIYLDAVTISGILEDILHDLNVIKEAEALDLTLSNN